MGSAMGLFLPSSQKDTTSVGTVADTDLQSHQWAKEAKAGGWQFTASLGYTVSVFKTKQNKVNTIFFTFQKPLGKIL